MTTICWWCEKRDGDEVEGLCGACLRREYTELTSRQAERVEEIKEYYRWPRLQAELAAESDRWNHLKLEKRASWDGERCEGRRGACTTKAFLVYYRPFRRSKPRILCPECVADLRAMQQLSVQQDQRLARLRVARVM